MHTPAPMRDIAVHMHGSQPRFLSPRRVVSEMNLWEGDHVIDMHPGAGHFVPHVSAAVGSRGRVYVRGTEREMLRTIHREAFRDGHTHVCLVPCEQVHDVLDIEAGTLDAALVVHAGRYVDADAVWSELARVIRREGKVCVVDWRESGGDVAGSEATPSGRERLIARLAEFGFSPWRDLTPHAVGSYHYGILFARR